MAEVYINSKLVGEVEDPHEFVAKFREERRRNAISQGVNISLSDNTQDIFVETQKGRARRPLLIVKDGKPLITEAHIKKLKLLIAQMYLNQNDLFYQYGTSLY